MKMEDFKMCSDGEFMPVSLPCPPPYSGPYYYYPYENIPFPPAEGYTNISSGGGGGISAGAVAGIIILVSFIFIMMCVCAVNFRSIRSLNIFGNTRRFSRRRNAGNNEGQAGDHQYVLNGAGPDHHMLVNIAGGGLEEKLVSLLPVFEYVGFQESKVDHTVQKGDHHERSSTECAVCLSSFEEKDIVRILPKCHHTFHLPCIDKWFESHANCPLCRERITLQTIQLYFKHPHDHCPNDPPDQLQHPAAGPLQYHQHPNLNHFNSGNRSDHIQNDQNPPAELPFQYQNALQPARPGADHHATDQQPTGLLMPPAGTATAIKDRHQNDQHSAAKYLDDHQLAGPAGDHHIVNDQQAPGLACSGLHEGLDNHQNLFLPEAPTGEAHDHHQIDHQPPAESCRHQLADQPARHVNGYHVSDQQAACAGMEGLNGHEVRLLQQPLDDELCTADHSAEEMMECDEMRCVSCNPEYSLHNNRSNDEKTTSNPEHLVVYIAPDHHPRTSFNYLFKRSLSTGCLNIELEPNRIRSSLAGTAAKEMF